MTSIRVGAMNSGRALRWGWAASTASLLSVAVPQTAYADLAYIVQPTWNATSAILECTGADDGVDCAEPAPPPQEGQTVSATADTAPDAGTDGGPPSSTFTPTLSFAGTNGGSASIAVSSSVTTRAITFSAAGNAIAGPSASPVESAVVGADLGNAIFEVPTTTEVELSFRASLTGGDPTSFVSVSLNSSSGPLFSYSTSAANFTRVFTLQPGVQYLYEVHASATPGEVDPGPIPNAEATLSVATTLQIGLTPAPATTLFSTIVLTIMLVLCGAVLIRRHRRWSQAT